MKYNNKNTAARLQRLCEIVDVKVRICANFLQFIPQLPFYPSPSLMAGLAAGCAVFSQWEQWCERRKGEESKISERSHWVSCVLRLKVTAPLSCPFCRTPGFQSVPLQTGVVSTQCCEPWGATYPVVLSSSLATTCEQSLQQKLF